MSEAAVAEIRRIAGIASALIDGDEARRIITDRAYYALTKTEDDPYVIGDHFDVDHRRFQAMKKFLLRLERFAQLPCDSTLWVRIPGYDERLTVAVRNGRLRRFAGGKQECLSPAPEPMRRCLDGRAFVVVEDEGLITGLAPILDSLQDAVGVLELNARARC